MNTYDRGDLIRCSANFKDDAGVDVDPTTVTFRRTDPAGTTVALVHGVDVALVKDSAGDYHADVNANLDGTWFYRFESTGTGQAAAEGAFYVKSEF